MKDDCSISAPLFYSKSGSPPENKIGHPRDSNPSVNIKIVDIFSRPLLCHDNYESLIMWCCVGVLGVRVFLSSHYRNENFSFF